MTDELEFSEKKFKKLLRKSLGEKMTIDYTDDQFNEALLLASEEQKRLLSKSKQLMEEGEK